jgi:hypothetical protein
VGDELPYTDAAAQLRALIPLLPEIGGSRAQNDLFAQLEAWCKIRSEANAAQQSAVAA